MSNYIRSVLKNNYFSVNVISELYEQELNAYFKLDTGCCRTSIPMQKLCVDVDICKKLKIQAIEDDIPRDTTYGVSDTDAIKERDLELIRQGRLAECTALSFLHEVPFFKIDNYNIGAGSIIVNYDRTGNLLIGMDIIKSLDVHIGTNKKGETVFLGCLKNNITDEYLSALKEEFGYIEECRGVASLFKNYLSFKNK